MDIASTLPEINPNYHPLPHYSPPEQGDKRSKLVSSEETFSCFMSTKNQRFVFFKVTNIV